jgi:hypothetical protein
MATPTTPLDPASWGTCPTCGDATPPAAESCPTCGKALTLPGTTTPIARSKRRLQWHTGFRILLVVAVAGVLTLAILPSVFSGPPVIPDPLTGTQELTLGAGNWTYFNGVVTGEDYITGNYSVAFPPGALVTFSIYNSTEFYNFAHHEPSQPVQPSFNVTNARILFSALYTDNYSFVWQNNYPVSSNITLTIWVTTDYETNVVVD